MNSHTRGWGLPAGKSHLNAQRALIFARSRKGDSDFVARRRQQLLVMAAFDKVRKRGLDDLPKLITVRQGQRPDRPAAVARERPVQALQEVDLKKAKRAVFGPKSFAVRAHGYTYHLVYARCKAWITKNFPKKRPYGTWPATVARRDRSRRPRHRLLRTDPAPPGYGSLGSDRRANENAERGNRLGVQVRVGECGLVPEGRPESP